MLTDSLEGSSNMSGTHAAAARVVAGLLAAPTGLGLSPPLPPPPPPREGLNILGTALNSPPMDIRSIGASCDPSMPLSPSPSSSHSLLVCGADAGAARSSFLRVSKPWMGGTLEFGLNAISASMSLSPSS